MPINTVETREIPTGVIAGGGAANTNHRTSVTFQLVPTAVSSRIYEGATVSATTAVIWAQGNSGAQAALIERMVLPDGTNPTLFGTGATVALIMRLRDTTTNALTTTKINYAAGALVDNTGINPVTGVAYGQGWIQYNPTALDTDTAAAYAYRWRVTFADASVVSFPNNDWLLLEVTAETSTPATA